MIIQALIIIIIGLIVNWIHSGFKNYFITFHLAALIASLCAVPWIIEMLIQWMRSKKNKTNGT